MTEKKDKDDEVVCEFFGIKITTKNPNVARALTTDISKIMNLDVRRIKSFMTEDEAAGSSENPDQEE